MDAVRINVQQQYVCVDDIYIQVYCSYSYDMIEDFFPFWDIHPFIIPSKNTRFRLRASEISPFLEFQMISSHCQTGDCPVLEEQGGKTQAGKWIQVMDFSGGQFMEVLPEMRRSTKFFSESILSSSNVKCTP